MKLKQNASLADKIADILTTAPAHLDPEDESDPETIAKVADKDSIENYDNLEEKLLSKFRNQNVDLLEDIDVRYGGERISRKGAYDSEHSSDSEALQKGM